MALTAEVKKTILKLIEQDKEFRLALAAKLGLLEILKKMEEHDRKFNEILERLDRNEKIMLRHEEILLRHEKILLRHEEKFNEILKRLDRHEEILLRHEKILLRHEEEIKRIWEEIAEIKKEIKKIWEKLEEHDKKFNEILYELRLHRVKLDGHDKRLSRIEMELGALTELLFTKDLYRDIMASVSREGDAVEEFYRNYRVDDLDMDLLIVTGRKVYVVEVKVKPKKKDVSELLRKARLVSNIYKTKKVVPILAGTRISDNIRKYALGRKVGVYDGFSLKIPS